MSHITQKKIGRDKFDTLDYYILVFSFFILFFKTFLVDQPTIYIYISINFFLHFFYGSIHHKTRLCMIFNVFFQSNSPQSRPILGGLMVGHGKLVCVVTRVRVIYFHEHWHIMWCCFSSNSKSSNALTYEGSCTIYWL